MANKPRTNANDLVQATILKKCDRVNHHPADSKKCAARDAGAAGGCQHTCQTADIETCRHKRTVRYSAHSVQWAIGIAW